MTIAFSENSATISTTEYSLPNNSTVLTPQTDECTLQGWIDFNALIETEEYEVRIYEKVTSSGSQRLFWESFVIGRQWPRILVLPTLMVKHGWDVTVKKNVGTDRAIGWSLRKVTGGTVTYNEGSASIGTTEYSFPNGSTTLTPITDDRIVQVFIDPVANLISGDEYLFQMYEKTRSASTQYVTSLKGAKNVTTQGIVFNANVLGNGWDATGKKIAGTDRSILYSVRKLA